MPLSEHEQRLLEQMEKALYAEDPKFATSLQSRGGAASRSRAALGVLAILGGLGIVLAGMAVPSRSSAWWASRSCWPGQFSSTSPSPGGHRPPPRR